MKNTPYSNPRSTAVSRTVSSLCIAAILGGCGGGGDASTAEDTGSAEVNVQYANSVDKHVDAAIRNAGGDKLLLDTYKTYYCMFAEDRLDLRTAARNDTGRVPLTQLFDDAWYIGSRYVGQFIFRSNSQFLLADSLNNTAEATQYTTPALQSLGLSPARPLTGVYLTHGHGDHDGGAAYLKTTYNPTITLGSADSAGKTYAPQQLNSANLEPVSMMLGGRNVKLLSTPGHTPGSTSAVIPVTDNGKEIKAVIVGGSSMLSDIPSAKSYLDSVERTYRLAAAERVSASMHPHPVFDGTLKFMDQINASSKPQSSPFVVGEERALRGLAIYRECSAAWLAKVDATAQLKTWRISKLETSVPTSGAPIVSVKLTTGWGPLANQKVTVKVNNGAASCVATTNNTGTGACVPAASQISKVEASFAGSETSTQVNLPSSVVSGN